MIPFRWVLSLCTVFVAAFTAFTGVVLSFVRLFSTEVTNEYQGVAELAIMVSTPLALGAFFLAALWVKGRRTTIAALIVAAIALIASLAAASNGVVRDIGGLVAYLIALLVYLVLALRSNRTPQLG